MGSAYLSLGLDAVPDTVGWGLGRAGGRRAEESESRRHSGGFITRLHSPTCPHARGSRSPAEAHWRLQGSDGQLPPSGLSALGVLFPAIPVPSFTGCQGLILSSVVDCKSPDHGQRRGS